MKRIKSENAKNEALPAGAESFASLRFGSKSSEDKDSEYSSRNSKSRYSAKGGEKYFSGRNPHVVLFCGGHAGTTAMATIQQLRRMKHPDGIEIHWAGSKYAFEGKNIPTLEYLALSQLGIKMHSITSGRLQTKFSIWTIPSMSKIPLGFFQAYGLLRKTKPDVIVSFGGYSSMPLVIAGRLLKIKIILHEQTVAAGRANRIASRYADIITLARKQSKSYFPSDRCMVIGNPVMEGVLHVQPKSKIGNPPVLLVLGGSRGATFINGIIKSALPGLLEDYIVIHQVGFIDYEEYKKFRESLKEELKKRLHVFRYIEPLDIHKYYNQADIVISRSGANAVAEIMHVKRPAILIPLPFAYLNEQKKNALFAQEYGIAKVYDQNQLNADTLSEAIREIHKNWKKIIKKTKNLDSPDRDAAKKLASIIYDLIK